MDIHEIFFFFLSENKTKSEFSWGSRENFHFGNGFIDDYQGNIVYPHKSIKKICKLRIISLILHSGN